MFYPFLRQDEFDSMEMLFLEVLAYDLHVSAELYAEYYYEMRALDKDSEQEYPKQYITSRKDFK